MIAHGRAMIPYDQAFDDERAIYFYGRYADNRLLTHFYTYLYWEDPHTEQIYKRIVRDRLHYHDDIFCGAGRVVKLLHENEAQVGCNDTVYRSMACATWIFLAFARRVSSVTADACCSVRAA
jgi:hypothetical protein